MKSMKKLLNGLAALGLTTIAATTAVACANNTVISNDLTNSFESYYTKDIADTDILGNYGLVIKSGSSDTYNFTFANLTDSNVAAIMTKKTNAVVTYLTVKQNITQFPVGATGSEVAQVTPKTANSELKISTDGNKTLTYTVTLKLFKAITQTDGTIKWVDQNTSMDVSLYFNTVNTKISISNIIPKTITLGTLPANTVADFNTAVQKQLIGISQLSKITAADYDIYKVNSTTKLAVDDITGSTGSLTIKLVAKGNTYTGSVDNVVANFDKATVIYNSVPDLIKGLNIASYAKIGTTDMNNVVEGILLDVFIGITRQTLSKSITFLEDKFKFHQDNIINLKTNKVLAASDLATATSFNLQVTADYDTTTNIQVGKCVLNVANKTDEEIVNFMNNYDFKSILTSDILRQEGLLYFNYMTVANLKASDLKRLSLRVLGSFGIQYVDSSKFTLNKFTKNGNDLTDAELQLPAGSQVTFKLNYNYGTITNQNLNITLNLSKFDISHLRWTDANQTVNLGTGQTPTSLTQANIDKIIAALKTTILNDINTAYTANYSKPLTASDIVITGFSELTVGSDFSNFKSVSFTVTAATGSAQITGTRSNQTLNVQATSS